MVSGRLEAQAAKTGAAAPAMVGYEDIGEAAFGALGRSIVSGVMYVELMGTCALLFILEVRGRREVFLGFVGCLARRGRVFLGFMGCLALSSTASSAASCTSS